MTFLVYVPYSQLDIDIAQTLENPLEGFYASLEELREYEGYECEWTTIEIDDMTLEYEDCFITFENISLN